MSEYTFVEKPLLTQLEAMGWKVHEQGAGIPQNPSLSLRTSFRDVLLKGEFFKAVKAINRLDDGRAWLTDAQLAQLFDEFSDFSTAHLLEANETFIERLYQWQIDTNEITGDQDPVVKIIDFEQWENNRFVAINQFRVDTPGGVKKYMIPDIVLFVNGLPLVVIECKDIDKHISDPMFQSIDQLRMYAGLREPEVSSLKEGEPRLFWTNQLMVAAHGVDCKYGTITSSEQHYFHWKTIYKDTSPYIAAPFITHRRQEQLVQGMLQRERLIDITRSFTLFMDSDSARIKVICRYQQYRAAHKIINRLKSGRSNNDRSGTVWHTQGSGKSLTMVFLVRCLRRDDELKDYKVLMVNDRKDLEKQLGETAALTGEKVYRVNSATESREKLADDASTLNMVMIHKFREEDDSNTPDYIAKAISSVSEPQAQYPLSQVAEPYKNYKMFESFDVINDSDKVLVLIDEAHRTQRSGQDQASLSDNLFDAFPNATRIAFTGTPLIADHHRDPTWKRFGNDPDNPYIDTYKLQDAVEDGATLQILYEGKTADTAIYDKHGFDTKFEDLFKDRSENELALIRKKYGATGDILEAEDRIEEIATDFVRHYITHILPSGFKAQVVCSSKQASIYYQKSINKALAQWIREEQGKCESKQDKVLLEKVRFLKTAVVISSDGTTEKASFVDARNTSRELNAIENFKNKFDSARPETGVAFLIVCDMLLTGFDAPIEQVMYVDKKLKEHTLLQAIARVNRTSPNKTAGYVVDYIGLTENLRSALSIYSGRDQDDILESFKSLESEVPVLESRYRRLIQLFEEKGLKRIEDLVNQRLSSDTQRYEVTETAVRLLEDVKTRDSFNVYLKKFMLSMDTILPNRLANRFRIPMYQFSHIQALARERYKDESINIRGAGEKVRKLVNEHLISLGINPKVPPVELFSDTFMPQIQINKDQRAAASEMEHAIRKHCKVNEGEDPILYKRFSEKLEEVLKKYQDNWDQMVLALSALRDEIDRGRGPQADNKGPFFDVIAAIAFGGSCPPDKEQATQVAVNQILEILGDDIRSLNFWEQPALISELEGKLLKEFVLSRQPAFKEKRSQLVTEVMALARRRERAILDDTIDDQE
jgi:type I restriction enzyme, R subunit